MPLAAAPATLALLALLAGCSAPATETPTDPGSGSEGTTETEAPTDGASGLDLPGQTVGSDTDCSFLSNDQVAEIWGFSVVDNDISMVIEAGGAGGILYGCDYNQSDDGTGLTIGVEVREFFEAAGATQYFADALSGAAFDGDGGILIEPVSGVGEEAGVQTNAELLGTPQNLNEILLVRNGVLMVQISVTDIINGVKPEYRELLVETYEAAFGG